MGSGWLGLPLARALIDGGHPVKLSTRTTERLPELKATGAEAFCVDLAQPGRTMEAFLESECLVINITSKDIPAFAALVDAIERAGVSRVIFVSSTSVYRNTNDVVREDHGDEAEDAPLFRIEQLFRESAAFATTVVRFAGLIGPGRHPGRFFSSGRAIRDPDAPVNLIHLDDSIEVLCRIIDDGIDDEVFSACSDSHPTKREFYPAAARSLGQPVPALAEGTESAFKIVSNDKLKRVLGYKMKYPDPMAMLHRPEAFASA